MNVYYDSNLRLSSPIGADPKLYFLVENISNNKKYRWWPYGKDISIPAGYKHVFDCYDYSGYLKDTYWSYPRITDNGEVY